MPVALVDVLAVVPGDAGRDAVTLGERPRASTSQAVARRVGRRCQRQLAEIVERRAQARTPAPAPSATRDALARGRRCLPASPELNACQTDRAERVHREPRRPPACVGEVEGLPCELRAPSRVRASRISSVAQLARESPTPTRRSGAPSGRARSPAAPLRRARPVSPRWTDSRAMHLAASAACGTSPSARKPSQASSSSTGLVCLYQTR